MAKTLVQKAGEVIINVGPPSPEDVELFRRVSGLADTPTHHSKHVLGPKRNPETGMPVYECHACGRPYTP